MCTLTPFLCLTGETYSVKPIVRLFILEQEGEYVEVASHKIDYG